MRGRQSVDEDHLPRALVVLEPLMDEGLELVRQLRSALARNTYACGLAARPEPGAAGLAVTGG